MNWNDEQDAVPFESDAQRKNRAKAFKLKKWIMNIEKQPKKSLEMKRKLAEYYKELDEIQDKRGGFTQDIAKSLIDSKKTRIRSR